MIRAAACLLALGLIALSSGPAMATTSVPTLPFAADVAPRANFTLYGDAIISGWGFSNATISKPGPTLAVYLGDSVELTLIARDTVQHNWFIDYNNNTNQEPGELASPNFNGVGDPKVVHFPFVADRPGNWTYRCGFHPTGMWGMLQVMPTGRPVNATLVGSFTRGWGLSNTTISKPGPEIRVGVGARVTLTLFANETGVPHNWFIDYNNDSQQGSGEPVSPDFNGPTDPKIVVFSFNATRAGTFTYRCGFHPTDMFGVITIIGQASAPTGLGVALVPAVMLIALGGVLVFALVYQVRSVRAAKRHK